MPKTDIERPGLARRAKAPLGLVLILGSLTAFGPISTDMYLPALPSLAASLHATEAQGQWTLAAFFIGISLGQLVYGPMADRYGRRWPLLFGMGLFLVATAGCALSQSIGVLIFFRVIQAFGGCAGMVIARTVVRDRFAAEEVLHVFSMLMLVMGLAPILAPLFGGWVLLVADWRWIFGAQGIFALIVGLAVVFGLPESRSEETAAQARSENAIGSYMALLKQPAFVGYLVTGGASGAALFTYVSCSSDVVIGVFHISPQAFGWVFGANAVGMIGATQANARLARRYPSDQIMGVANTVVLGIAAVLLLDAATGFGGLWGVLVPLFFIMAAMGFNQSNASAGAFNVDPRRAGATSALLGATSFGVGAGASAIAGLLRDGTAKPMGLVIFASLLVATISFRMLIAKRR